MKIPTESHIAQKMFTTSIPNQCICQDCEGKVDAVMEADPSLSYSWLNDALQQLFLARKCMAYRWVGGRGTRRQTRGGCVNAVVPVHE